MKLYATQPNASNGPNPEWNFSAPCPFCGAFSTHEHQWRTLSHIESVLVYFFHGFKCPNPQGSKIHIYEVVEEYAEYKKLVYPKFAIDILPLPQMPKDAKQIFEEARLIGNDSPRAAVALLRLATELLVRDLLRKTPEEYREHNLSYWIKNELSKLDGWNTVMENAFTALRFVGNDAIHPQSIGDYFVDNSMLMQNTFRLLNMCVERFIIEPQMAKSMLETFSSAKDKNATTSPQGSNQSA